MKTLYLLIFCSLFSDSALAQWYNADKQCEYLRQQNIPESTIKLILNKHTTPHKNYYQFVPINSDTYRICWGNDSINNVSQAIYNEVYAESQSMGWEDSRFLAIHGHTGTGAWHDIILPLNNGAKDFVVSNILSKNLKYNIVVTEEDCSEDTLLRVINLETRSVFCIVDKTIPPSPTYHAPVYKIEISKEFIVVYWNLGESGKVIKKKYNIFAS